MRGNYKLLLIFIFLLTNLYSVFSVEDNLNVERPADYTYINWCYGKSPDCGESTWRGLCQTGLTQSPINLPGNITTVRRLLKHAKKISGFPRSTYVLRGYKLEFTGRTLQVWPLDDKDQTRLGFRWTNNNEEINYLFHGLHFHWGSKDEIGSEHAIESRSFPGEVQLTYFDKNWGNMDTALRSKEKDAILVISVFLEVIDRSILDDLDLLASEVLKPIVSNLQELEKGREYVESTVWLNLAELFVGREAYTYLGSLTTPKCNENIRWVVIRRPVIVPVDHMKAFRETKFFEKGTFANNFRSLQRKHTDSNLGLVRVKYS